MINTMSQGQNWTGDGYIKTKHNKTNRCVGARYSVSVYSFEFVRLTLSKRRASSSRETFFSLMSYEDGYTFE